MMKDPGTKEDFATLFSTRQGFFFFLAAAVPHELVKIGKNKKHRTRLLHHNAPKKNIHIK
jgi:hypothetical protein